MGIILKGVFEPEDIEAMALAHGGVCDALHINGDARARETIAIRVIELAQHGERCATVLRDRVLWEAGGGTANASWRRLLGPVAARAA
jgi:hypothetical protein